MSGSHSSRLNDNKSVSFQDKDFSVSTHHTLGFSRRGPFTTKHRCVTAHTGTM